ncbi:MAG TPA: hypothetical protein VGW38_10765, partial [Chloroflexota bacterium]|nr:hypothetical protein [Chloroflexota bacterium]
LIVEAQALEAVPAPNTPRSVRQGAGLPPGIPGTVQEPLQSQEGISIGDVLDAPERFAGRTVVLTGEVGREYGPFAFTLEEEGFISDDAILVVSGRPLPGWQRNELPLIPEDRTRIRGVVYQFNLQQFERGLGVDLDNALAEWNGRPVVLLTAIDLQPDRQQR